MVTYWCHSLLQNIHGGSGTRLVGHTPRFPCKWNCPRRELEKKHDWSQNIFDTQTMYITFLNSFRDVEMKDVGTAEQSKVNTFTFTVINLRKLVETAQDVPIYPMCSEKKSTCRLKPRLGISSDYSYSQRLFCFTHVPNLIPVWAKMADLTLSFQVHYTMPSHLSPTYVPHVAIYH